MFTLEQKVDLILRYIATNDNVQRSQLKKMVVKALDSDDAVPTTVIDVDDLIFDMLKTLGLPQHLLGHKYVTRAIKLYILDPTYGNNITKRLYPDIAALYDTTGSRVERAIRHAIEATFDNGNLEDITRAFGNTVSIYSGRITNMEFIISCANEITRRMKKMGVEVV